MGKLKRFIRYYKPHRSLFGLDMLCVLIASGVDLAFPLLVRRLIDTGLGGERGPDMALIAGMAGMMLALYALRYACDKVMITYGHRMGAMMEYDMRRDIFAHLEKLSFTYYDNNKTGQLMSRITNDLFDITELSHHGPEELLLAATKITGAFIILFGINPMLTFVTFVFLPPLVIFSIYFNKKMRRIFAKNRQKIAEINAQIEDSLGGIRVVQSFVAEEAEKKKFDAGNTAFLDTKKESYSYLGTFHGGVSFLEGVIYIAAVATGTYFIAATGMPVSSLVAYLLYISTLLNPIRALISFTEQFQRGATGFERFLEIMDTEPDIADRPGACSLTRVEGRVTFENVSFSYENGVRVLDNMSVDIEPGRTVALVGPSGGGKTTFCNLIPRFYEVESGKITLDGTDIRDITLSSLRSNVGIVSQDVYLFAGTIMENIRYGKPEAGDDEVFAAARAANAHEFITAFEAGYDTYVGERGVKLSGGQKQRISIARVFLKNPPVLILDEATSALDNQSERVVQQSLERLAENRTTFIIAHRLSTVRHADIILVLTEEGLVESGTHASLIASGGLYAKLYGMQFDGM